MGTGPFFALTASGEEIPVDISLGPLSGSDFVIAVLRDLRPIKQLEARGRELDRRFRTTFEQAAVGIVHVSPDASRWVAVNRKACEITGFSEGQLLSDVPSSFSQVDESVRDLLLGPEQSAVVREVCVKQKSGGELWVRMTYSAARSDAGQVEYFVNVIEDIDLRRRSEQLLQQAQRLDGLGRMASAIAHDFNNLLSVMLSYSESLAADEGLDESQRSQAAEIRDTARRGAELTQQLLSFGRRQRLRIRSLRCEECLKKFEGLLAPILGPAISFTWSVEHSGLSVLADESQFDQVMMNLAINARDAMPAGGTISVSVTQRLFDQPSIGPSRFVVFEVKDAGTGIPSEVLPHIFEPFFTTKSEGKGTGLGLATVHAIVVQNGGTISVATGPQGTTFSVLWPAGEADSELDVSQPPTSPVEIVLGNGERLLVVEDDPNVRRLLHATLAHAGYFVTVASNGAEALYLLTQPGARFDALVTDLQMPILGGVELVNRLSALEWRKPVLFVSAQVDELPESLRQANIGRLLKPFGRADLLASVHRLFSDAAGLPTP